MSTRRWSDVFALLQAEIVADGAGGDLLGAAETSALVTDDGFDGGEQFRRSHDADGDARAAEDGLNDLAVAVVGNDDTVVDGVAADDAARRELSG